MTAILLVGHGSRNRDSVGCLYDVARELRERHGYEIVEVAFLELCPPNIQEGFDACVRRGAERVLLLPYFLFPGGHVYRDLPDELERAMHRHPGLEARLGDVLGYHPALVDIVHERIASSRERAGW